MMAAVLGGVDVIAGFVMLHSALRITDSATLRTTQGRWAWFRRVVYGSASIAVFGLGVGRLNGEHPVGSLSEFLFQLVVLFSLMIFPVLRAFNLITQDQFKSVDGNSKRIS